MSSETEAFSPLASVVFLGIPGFAHKPVAEHALLRKQLDASIAAASLPLDAADRIILDALDGAAIVVLSNPLGALQAAQRALGAAVGGPFGVGLNHGPVTLAAGEGNEAGLMGDGIDAAMRIAAFAPAGGLLVSRSFRDALVESAPDLARQFQPAGTFTDTHVRAHELFLLDDAASRARNRRRIGLVVLACVGILGLGLGARFALRSLVESRQPAFLVFDIRPQGEIFVDGVSKGRATAVTRLQVAAGAHTVEVRHGRFPPFVTEVNLNPGEQAQLKHSFVVPAAKKSRGFLEGFKFWQ
jgi:hypothetical protein